MTGKEGKIEGRKTEKWVRIATILLVLSIGFAGGGYVYAKYFSESARWGVAIASGVYFTANYAAESEEFIESIVSSEYNERVYGFNFEVRNYENNLLFNESDVVIPYSLSFWLEEEPDGARYTVLPPGQGQTQQELGVGEENKVTITGQSIAGGKARANKYALGISLEGSSPLDFESLPIYVEVQTAESSLISKTLRGKMILQVSADGGEYIQSQGFVVPAEGEDEFERLLKMSEFSYEVRTGGEVATGDVTEALKLSWDPAVLEIDMFDDAYVEWLKSHSKPNVDTNGWYYITVQVMPYSVETIGFFRGESFDENATDMETLLGFIKAEKYVAE